MRSNGDQAALRTYGAPSEVRAPGADHPVADFPDPCPGLPGGGVYWTDDPFLDDLTVPQLAELARGAAGACLEGASWLPERRRGGW